MLPDVSSVRLFSPPPSKGFASARCWIAEDRKNRSRKWLLCWMAVRIGGLAELRENWATLPTRLAAL